MARPRYRSAMTLVAALALTAASCSMPAGPGRTGPSGAPALSEVPMPDFTLTTTAFPAGGTIPARFTCDGEDTSPDLAWSGAPADAQSFVLVVDDPDANGFVHWIAFDLTGSESGGLAAGISASPDAPPQGTNDFGRVGWNGPCPPSGEHRYRFTLTALAAPLGLAGAPNGAQVRRALAGATILGSAVLEGRYARR